MVLIIIVFGVVEIFVLVFDIVKGFVVFVLVFEILDCKIVIDFDSFLGEEVMRV